MDFRGGADAPPAAPAADDRPTLHGQRIDWRPRDVFFGLLWFLALFIVIPIPILAPFLIAFDDTSSEFYIATFAVGAISEVGLVVVAAYFTFRKYGGSWARLGFRMPRWSTLGWAIAAIVAAYIFAAAYGIIIDYFNIDALTQECDDQIPREVLDDPLAMAVASVLIIGFAPICEETFFRGFVFPGLAKWGIVVAIIASGFLFSVAHLSPNMHKTIIPIFGIGVIFGAAYFKSGNILSVVGAHLVFNSFATAALWMCEPS